MALNFSDRIGESDFLNKYLPVDLNKGIYFQEIKKVSPRFFEICELIQQKVLAGEMDDASFTELTSILKQLNTEEVERVTGVNYSITEFIRCKIFTVKSDYLQTTLRGESLEELLLPNDTLDFIYSMYSPNPNKVDDNTGEEFRTILSEEIDKFKPKTKIYISELISKKENTGIFLSFLIRFINDYRSNLGITTTEKITKDGIHKTLSD
ncbi:hypothetical protein GW846_02820 [Candidatus Gracilibacteria bacterium]|nr:hypothetical protein [Candidatus Gracilibacteria bacterium]